MGGDAHANEAAKAAKANTVRRMSDAERPVAALG